MSERRLAGFQKRTRPEDYKEVGLARISYEGAETFCSCGWSYGHSRDKVREDAIDKHLAKRHEGRGIRL